MNCCLKVILVASDMTAQQELDLQGLQKSGGRVPAAGSGQGNRSLHVNHIDIGAFFAVDLDVDKALGLSVR